MLTLLLLLFSLYYAFVIFFLYQGLNRLKPGINTQQHSYCIVIAARNEEKTIERCITSVFNQKYPKSLFEVIVVNDRSSDSTQSIVEGLKDIYKRLKLINIKTCPPDVSPKKHALSKGIAAAKSDIILFTDSDCVVKPNWISRINGHFYQSAGAVAGLTTYHRPMQMGRIFFGLQAVDFFSHAVVAASAIGAGFPVNTNANNFAVRKKLIQKIKGFSSFKHIVSGDDDLLLQAISKATHEKIHYCIEPEGAVTTEPTGSLRGIWEQRKRWSSKTVFYNKKQVFFLSGIFIYYCLIFLAFLLSLGVPAVINSVLLAFLFKSGLDLILAYRGMVLFNKTELLPFFFPMAIFHIPLIIISCFFGIFGKFTWKKSVLKKSVS